MARSPHSSTLAGGNVSARLATGRGIEAPFAFAIRGPVLYHGSMSSRCDVFAQWPSKLNNNAYGDDQPDSTLTA